MPARVSRIGGRRAPKAGLGAADSGPRGFTEERERPRPPTIATVSAKRRGGRVDAAGRRVREASFPRISRQTPMQRHFLKRLERLVVLGRYGQKHPVFSTREVALLKKATYSVYRDCAAMGLLDEARSILRATGN